MKKKKNCNYSLTKKNYIYSSKELNGNYARKKRKKKKRHERPRNNEPPPIDPAINPRADRIQPIQLMTLFRITLPERQSPFPGIN